MAQERSRRGTAADSGCSHEIRCRRALELLDDLLSEFPFVDVGLDRSVALAGIMTPVLRGAFPVAPLFFIAKPEAGTGASYFVRVVGTISTGQDASPLLASEDPRELQKELSAKAFEGRPILNLNNLTFDLESALLCQMLTEGVVDIRPFGRNDQTVSCDCRSTTVFANGNNIKLVGDRFGEPSPAAWMPRRSNRSYERSITIRLQW